VEPGQYQFPFSFVLPVSLPTTPDISAACPAALYRFPACGKSNYLPLLLRMMPAVTMLACMLGPLILCAAQPAGVF
jgi:hypothetical protein